MSSGRAGHASREKTPDDDGSGRRKARSATKPLDLGAAASYTVSGDGYRQTGTGGYRQRGGVSSIDRWWVSSIDRRGRAAKARSATKPLDLGAAASYTVSGDGYRQTGTGGYRQRGGVSSIDRRRRGVASIDRRGCRL